MTNLSACRAHRHHRSAPMPNLKSNRTDGSLAALYETLKAQSRCADHALQALIGEHAIHSG